MRGPKKAWLRLSYIKLPASTNLPTPTPTAPRIQPKWSIILVGCFNSH